MASNARTDDRILGSLRSGESKGIVRIEELDPFPARAFQTRVACGRSPLIGLPVHPDATA